MAEKPKYRNRHTRLNTIYAKMMDRCYNPNEKSYPAYGGAGVTVCDRWYKNYKHFKEDMLPSYSDDLTIDRVDNKKGYSPENCRWATMEEQQNNRQNNRLVEFRGEKQTLSRWARELNIKRSTLSQRFYVYGWSVERCLTTPTRKAG
jgi:hypothetical protein